MQNNHSVLNLEALEDRLLLSSFPTLLGDSASGARFTSPAASPPAETFLRPVDGFGTSFFSNTDPGIPIPGFADFGSTISSSNHTSATPGIPIPGFPNFGSTIFDPNLTLNPNLLGFGLVGLGIPARLTPATVTQTTQATETSTPTGVSNPSSANVGSTASSSPSGTSNQNLMGFGPITQTIQGPSTTTTGTGATPLDQPPTLLPGLDGFYASLAASGFAFAIPPGVKVTG